MLLITWKVTNYLDVLLELLVGIHFLLMQNYSEVVFYLILIELQN